MNVIGRLTRGLTEPVIGMKLERSIAGVTIRAEIVDVVENVPIVRIENGPLEALNNWDQQGWISVDPFPVFPERWLAIWTTALPKVFSTAAAALSAVDAGGRAADYILHVWSDATSGPAGEFSLGSGIFQS